MGVNSAFTVGTTPVSGQTFDVKATGVAGKVTLNGAATTGLCSPSNATLAFTDKSSGAVFSTGTNGSLSFSATIPPGTYSVVVSSIGTCTQLPNGEVLVVCTLSIP